SPGSMQNENSGSENITEDKTPEQVTPVIVTHDNGNDKNDPALITPLAQRSSMDPRGSSASTTTVEVRKPEDALTFDTKPDSIRYPAIEKQKTNKKPFRFFASITPVFTYQRITPHENDRIVISRFGGRPMFSSDRLGVNFDAALEGK